MLYLFWLSHLRLEDPSTSGRRRGSLLSLEAPRGTQVQKPRAWILPLQHAGQRLTLNQKANQKPEEAELR